MMNPLSWSREHQLALLIVAVIGAALATVLGYLVYAAGWEEGAVPFESWLRRLFGGPIWWAAVIGGAIVFVCNLLRGPMVSAGSRPAGARGDRTAQEAIPDRSQQRLPGRMQERTQERTQDNRAPLPPRPRW
jgi:H+/Cl- antiporter ClcA